MIFDSIAHVTPDGRWFHTDHDASESRLLQQLDAARVEHAVVVALAALAALAGHISNEFVLDLCRRHVPRLIPGASFNPAAYPAAAEAARELRTQLQGGPFRLLKLHPRLNRYDPLDPRCRAVLEEIASWPKPLPVWLDTLFYFATGSSRKPVVDTIHDLVISFPKIQFVLLHGGGNLLLQVAEAIRDCPNVVDLSVQYPAPLTAEQEAAVAEMCHRAVRALGLSQGVGDVEFTFTQDGLKLFEIGARCGGGHTPQIARHVCGVDEFIESCQMACGIGPSQFDPLARGGPDYHFLILPAGKQAAVSVPQSISAHANMLDVGITLQPGDTVHPLQTTAERAGFVVTVAENRAKAVQVADWACREISIRYVDGTVGRAYTLSELD